MSEFFHISCSKDVGNKISIECKGKSAGPLVCVL
jgi:hypothetical protein